MSRHQAAAHFGVAVSAAIKWMQRVRMTGSAAPGQIGGRKPRAIASAHREWLIQRRQRQDFTLRGLAAALAERGLKVDYRSVWAFVHGENLSYKKTVLAHEQDRPDIARRRAQWRTYQGRLDPSAPLRGWGLRGRRLLSKAPYGRWSTVTFIAALRHDRIDTPWLLSSAPRLIGRPPQGPAGRGAVRTRSAAREDRPAGGSSPFGHEAAVAMSRSVSPISGKPYGLAAVCRVWRLARSGVYRQRAPRTGLRLSAAIPPRWSATTARS